MGRCKIDRPGGTDLDETAGEVLQFASEDDLQAISSKIRLLLSQET